jgi:predicted transcriptional regulator
MNRLTASIFPEEVGERLRQDQADRTACEDRRDQLTQEALADVDAGQVIAHQAVLAWAESLDSDQPLTVPR